jgi:hypothetical protein
MEASLKPKSRILLSIASITASLPLSSSTEHCPLGLRYEAHTTSFYTPLSNTERAICSLDSAMNPTPVASYPPNVLHSSTESDGKEAPASTFASSAFNSKMYQWGP